MVVWADESTVPTVARYALPPAPPSSDLGDAILDGAHELSSSVREAGLAVGIGAFYLDKTFDDFKVFFKKKVSPRLGSPSAQA